ncbi:MAG: hypothetical protein M3O50_17220 [Myxococcota bacterium]|nr:hypothetical protein [Myxococcota bacterium]
MRAAIAAEFTFKPIALQHLNWFLADGHGTDFVENANIAALLTQDLQIRRLLQADIRRRGDRGS